MSLERRMVIGAGTPMQPFYELRVGRDCEASYEDRQMSRTGVLSGEACTRLLDVLDRAVVRAFLADPEACGEPRGIDTQVTFTTELEGATSVEKATWACPSAAYEALMDALNEVEGELSRSIRTSGS